MSLSTITFGVLSLWPICMAIAFGYAVSGLQFAQFWAFSWLCMCTFGACIGAELLWSQLWASKAGC